METNLATCSRRSLVLLVGLSLSALSAVSAATINTSLSKPTQATTAFQSKFDVAAKQLSLDKKARPTFYYLNLPAAGSARTTGTTATVQAPSLTSLKSSSPFSWGLRDSRDIDSGSGHDLGSFDFLSGFLPSQGPFPLPPPSSSPFRSIHHSPFSESLGPGGGRTSSLGSGSFRSTKLFASNIKSRDIEEDVSGPSTSSPLFGPFSTSLSGLVPFPDSLEKGSERRERLESSTELPRAVAQPLTAYPSELDDLDPDRQPRDADPDQQTTPWSRERAQRLRSRHQRRRQHLHGGAAKGKEVDTQSNYTDQEYRVPYSEDRGNGTDYKYYEDHGGNDTYREHHYRHVVSTHYYYNGTNNASDVGESAGYSKDAAYDTMNALKEAKKPSTNYNLDYVYKDGRYIPITHKVPQANQSNYTTDYSKGIFPSGVQVKHHYYNNNYEHDHRNKSEGPVVRHHYHNKDFKVFYHDHRNKSDSSSSMSGSYSPAGTDASGEGSAEDSYGSKGGERDADGKLVKHHHYVKEFHYDANGKLIDPQKYNYTNKYKATQNESAEQADDSRSEEEGSRGGRSNYGKAQSSESHSDSSEENSSTESGYESERYQNRGTTVRSVAYTTARPTHTSSRDYRDRDKEYPTTRAPSLREMHHDYEHTRPVSSTLGYREYKVTHSHPPPPSPPLSLSHSHAHAHPHSLTRPHTEDSAFYRQKDRDRPVNYQLHYRDFGDQSFATKDVSFDNGFTFHNEKRNSGRYDSFGGTSAGGAGFPSTSSYSVSYPTTLRNSYISNESREDDAPRYESGYRPPPTAVGARFPARHVVTRSPATGTLMSPMGPGPSGPMGPMGPPSPRAEQHRNLVSRGNIGYILVDPLGELPTIRIHASLVNAQVGRFASAAGGAGFNMRRYFRGVSPEMEASTPLYPKALRRADHDDDTPPIENRTVLADDLTTSAPSPSTTTLATTQAESSLVIKE